MNQRTVCRGRRPGSTSDVDRLERLGRSRASTSSTPSSPSAASPTSITTSRSCTATSEWSRHWRGLKCEPGRCRSKLTGRASAISLLRGYQQQKADYTTTHSLTTRRTGTFGLNFILGAEGRAGAAAAPSASDWPSPIGLVSLSVFACTVEPDAPDVS
jgi:hypothetical protein